VYALLDSLGAVAIGLTMATLVTSLVYVDSDKFFTRFETAQTKNFIIMMVQAFLLFLCLIYKWMRTRLLRDSLYGRENTIRADENPDADRMQPRPLKFFAKLAQALPFAVLFATFFFVFLKLPQFCSLFWFT
jgi:hypothetical protein